MDFSTARQRLSTSMRQRGITDPAVLEAILQVPRHMFVNPAMAEYAYVDSALPIAWAQTISQPYVVAFMTQAAGLTARSRVLEIGTGSGYQAAILAEICQEVFTIEVREPLERHAAMLLKELGYDNIHTRLGNGYMGWPEAAPFDAIIVTAAAKKRPSNLLAQLNTGGRLIIPIEAVDGTQTLTRITKIDGDQYNEEKLLDVLFVPMVE